VKSARPVDVFLSEPDFRADRVAQSIKVIEYSPEKAGVGATPSLATTFQKV
jgi:hypothetical protein